MIPTRREHKRRRPGNPARWTYEHRIKELEDRAKRIERDATIGLVFVGVVALIGLPGALLAAVIFAALLGGFVWVLWLVVSSIARRR